MRVGRGKLEYRGTQASEATSSKLDPVRGKAEKQKQKGTNRRVARVTVSPKLKPESTGGRRVKKFAPEGFNCPREHAKSQSSSWKSDFLTNYSGG